MLDVIHYYFEQDSVHSSEEHIKSQSNTRETLYRDLYGTEYKYKYREKGQSNNNYVGDLDDLPVDEEEEIKPFDPLAGPPKAFVPATEFNPEARKPFGDVLDSPLG